MRNIQKTLSHFNLTPKDLTHRSGRIYIKIQEGVETASHLTQIFGVSSTSPATETTSKMPQIVQTAIDLAISETAEWTSFAVRCNRVGTHPYSSMDVCKEAGKFILENLKDRHLRVDLTKPQLTIGIEVWNEEAYVYSQTFDGPGGFPLGSQGKVVCLLSGGIDSPVAGWLAMKRGCTVVPIYLDNAPLSDETNTSKALETARKLSEWAIGFPMRTYVVPNGRNLETFMEKAPRRFTCLLCKRMMYRIAERIADLEKAEGIVTGEAIGEQASQTITNLRVLDEAAAKYPIHRPLLGFDKVETEALARKIGTLAASIRKAKSCGGAPNQPATKAKLEMVKNAEQTLDIEKMADESAGAAKIVAIRFDEAY
jgi:thiamine biosynthesis protein ThiI